MTGGRNGKPLGNALHNAHQDGFDDLKKRKYPSLCTKAQQLIFFQYTILCLCYARRMRKFLPPAATFALQAVTALGNVLY